jgi:aryl-alcohol dehydrogenase-like predicted oxidoreductase
MRKIMFYAEFPGMNKRVARLIQGTSEFRLWSPRRVWSILDAVYERGGNTFDTAHSYGNGKAERLLGQWLKAHGRRDEVVIITKGAHPNADRSRLTPCDITSDLYDSLARLQVDYIDLYLLHRDDPAVPVAPLIETLNEHLAAGRICAFGASNWQHERIQEANEYALAQGLTPFVASSPQLSLAEPIKEPWPGCVMVSGRSASQARAWYRQTQMPLIAWSSLASGFFSGRFSPQNLASFTAELDRVCLETYCSEENFERLARATALGAAKGLTAAQIALAYVVYQPENVFAIVGSRTAKEFSANVAAIETPLTPQEMNWLDLSQDRR